MSPHPARIVSFEEFEALRNEPGNNLGTIVATSGGFDPVHPGHASCFYEAKKLGDTLVVIVNGDTFLKNKKGKPFMDIKTRCHLVSFMKGVDYVIPFEIENDQTVAVALRTLKPHIFAKGGDRVDDASIPAPEPIVCKELDIKIIYGVGLEKLWSSSNFLGEWEEFVKNKPQKD